jgi:hypothetical protein
VSEVHHKAIESESEPEEDVNRDRKVAVVGLDSDNISGEGVSVDSDDDLVCHNMSWQ